MRLTRLLVAGGLGLAVLTAVTGAAQASSTAASKWKCSNGSVCLYDKPNGATQFWQEDECGIHGLGTGFLGKASSVRNRTGTTVTLFTVFHANGGPNTLAEEIVSVEDGDKVNLEDDEDNATALVYIPCD
ncbi:peptidase inhibitor family I36 protein [Nonomuraea sp. NPDC049152]|uniref:peptidase inhibitor family I36 protein n=1 Tax=Nonomuraea sp. NPDC049152 TaxID=3154350 RepID=UPI0033F169C6